MTRSGQSLIELLVGIAISVILIVGVATIVAPSLQIGKQTAYVQTKTELANEMFSSIKAWAAGNWNNVLSVATGSANTYYLNTSVSPFAVGTSSVAGWAYSRTITVTSTASIASGTQTSFPMLVSSTLASWESTSTAGGAGHVQNLCTAPNGGQEPCDLVFATSSANCGIANLNFQTESYTSSTGALVDWVNVPSLSAGTVIYACYGNTAVTTDQSHPSLTWDGNYKGVWHLAETSGNALDSTSDGFNSNTLNVTTQGTPAQIGNGVKVTTSGNYIEAAANATFPKLSGSWTMSEWVKFSTISTFQGIIALDTAGGGNISGPLLQSDGSIRFQYLNGNAGLTYTGSNLTTGNWYYVVATSLGSNQAFNMYVNGVNVMTGTTPNSALGTNTLVDFAGHPSFLLNGFADEARISTSVRSPDWIKTEYNNQSSPGTFYAIGSETVAGGGGGSSQSETITVAGVPFTRYFYLNDAYRDANGNATTTASGNMYDPSTKFFVIVVSAATTPTTPSTTESFYLSRNGDNVFDHTDWSGGSGQNGPVTLTNNQFASSSGIDYSDIPGSITALPPAGGTITFDVSSTAVGNNVTHLNKSITIGSGSNEMLSISIGGGCTTLSSVTVGGNPATFAVLASTTNNPYRASEYYYLGLPPGSVSVTSTCSAASYYTMGLASFFGVNQTAPIDGSASGSWPALTSHMPSLNVTTTVQNDLLVGAVTANTSTLGNLSGSEILLTKASTTPSSTALASSYRIVSATGTYAIGSWSALVLGPVDQVGASFEPLLSGPSTGELDSPTFDTGVASGAQFNSILWQGNQATGSTVQFQFAVSNSSSGPWNFKGTDGTSYTYYTPIGPGSVLDFNTTVFSGYRYFRYQIFITYANGASSQVNDVIVNWSP